MSWLADLCQCHLHCSFVLHIALALKSDLVPTFQRQQMAVFYCWRELALSGRVWLQVASLNALCASLVIMRCGVMFTSGWVLTLCTLCTRWFYYVVSLGHCNEVTDGQHCGFNT